MTPRRFFVVAYRAPLIVAAFTIACALLHADTRNVLVGLVFWATFPYPLGLAGTAAIARRVRQRHVWAVWMFLGPFVYIAAIIFLYVVVPWLVSVVAPSFIPIDLNVFLLWGVVPIILLCMPLGLLYGLVVTLYGAWSIGYSGWDRPQAPMRAQ